MLFDMDDDDWLSAADALARDLLYPEHQVEPVHRLEDRLTPEDFLRQQHEATGDPRIDRGMGPRNPDGLPPYTDAELVYVNRDDPWEYRWTLARKGGALVVRGLQIRPTTRETPDRGVTSTLLRNVSPSSAIVASAQHSTDPLLQSILEVSSLIRERYGPGGTADNEPADPTLNRKPGRPPIPEAELVRVAMTYIDAQRAVAREGGHGVIRRVADELDMPEGTVRDRVRMCRTSERGLLAPTVRGQKNAEPGPRLLELLQEAFAAATARRDSTSTPEEQS